MQIPLDHEPILELKQAVKIHSNIFSFLKSYGLTLNQNLVLDKSCSRVQVLQQMGFIRMNVPMDYPFLPIVKNFNEQELVVSGLEQIHLFFPSQIMLDTLLSDNVIGIVDLFTSSNKSGIMSDRFMLSPDPKSNPFIQNLNQRGKVLGAASRITSGSEIILISDSKFLSDDAGMSVPENMVFTMNAVDYLAGEKELIALRSREITKSASFNKFANKSCIEHLPDSNYWHYCLQLNTYKAILESKYGIIVTEMYLICLHPDNKNKNYQRIKVVDLGDEINSLFKLRRLEVS